MDRGLKRWQGANAWTGAAKVKVAVGVQSAAVTQLVLERMSA